jgi:hypothetical protein
MFRPASRTTRRCTLLLAAALLAAAPILAALAQNQSQPARPVAPQPPRSAPNVAPAQQTPAAGGAPSPPVPGDNCGASGCPPTMAPDGGPKVPVSRADLDVIVTKLDSITAKLETVQQQRLEKSESPSGFLLFIAILVIALTVIIAVWAFGRVLFKKWGFPMRGEFIPPVTGGRLGPAGGTAAKPLNPRQRIYPR